MTGGNGMPRVPSSAQRRRFRFRSSINLRSSNLRSSNFRNRNFRNRTTRQRLGHRLPLEAQATATNSERDQKCRVIKTLPDRQWLFRRRRDPRRARKLNGGRLRREHRIRVPALHTFRTSHPPCRAGDNHSLGPARSLHSRDLPDTRHLPCNRRCPDSLSLLHRPRGIRGARLEIPQAHPLPFPTTAHLSTVALPAVAHLK